jgi:hypothetical protein
MSYNLTEIPGEFSGKHPVAADAIIEIGGLVARNAAGNSVAADDTVDGAVIGRAYESIDNTGGAAGDQSITVKTGAFGCANSATNPVDKTHVGKMVYAEAPDIIASEGTCQAGILIGFDESGRPLVDTRLSELPTQVTLTSTNGTAAGAADLAALKVETEKIGDDVRAIHAALVARGFLIA